MGVAQLTLRAHKSTQLSRIFLASWRLVGPSQKSGLCRMLIIRDLPLSICTIMPTSCWRQHPVSAQVILTFAETDGAKNAIPSRLHSLDSYFSMMILRLSTGNFRREFGAPFSKLSFLLNAVFVSYSKRSKFRKPYS